MSFFGRLGDINCVIASFILIHLMCPPAFPRRQLHIMRCLKNSSELVKHQKRLAVLLPFVEKTVEADIVIQPLELSMLLKRFALH